MSSRQQTAGSRQPPALAAYLLPLSLLLALGLRLLLWSAPLHQPANDEIEYIAVARDLLAGRGWQFYEHYHWLRAPLYPLFLAGSLWLAGGDPASAEALHRAALPNILLSVANVYLGYHLARALAGARAASIAGLIGAALWTLATFASLYMAETLFTFLFTAALLCLVRRPLRLGTIALGGVLFGLATLTRSVPLLFLPLAALWLLAHEPSGRSQRPPGASASRFWAHGSRFYPALLFVLAATLTIAPWTLRNYAAYGRLIPVETGLSYNLWAFNEPREDAGTIFRTLENIGNPAERADYASAKGLARLREDPAILVRKLWPNWVYTWRVKPIEDRFLQENYYSDVPLALFGAALLFDDALYLVIALAGIAGLVLWDQARTLRQEWRTERRGQRGAWRFVLGSRLAEPRWLMIGWVLYCLATMMLTHGEARYRHFLFPALVPYAAWALARMGRHEGTETRRPREATRVAWSPGRLVACAVGALVGGTVLAYYPWGWATQNLARGWYAQRAALAWALGDQAGALRLDAHALDVSATLDGWLRLGDHARASGDTAQALAAYKSARALGPGYTPMVARLGDLLRATGDDAGARAAFGTGYVDLQQLTDWSWRELQPPPRDKLAIGDGLDFGYIGGVYPAERLQGTQARWTNGRGVVRFGVEPGATAGTQRGLVRLRLAAPWPGGTGTAAQVCAGGECQPLQLGPGWQIYLVPLAIDRSAAAQVEIRSDTFSAPDGRRLGVVVDEVVWIEYG
ncbi:MAG: glycosyltransferase family 39 protein [Kouleothrix sp.]|jgi:4-amino-4-deoxy-L-arabinose transferase-like glycosyltransferase|nr:glycosyltransferase family 39 protein [Kouleothrix sp.]